MGDDTVSTQIAELTERIQRLQTTVDRNETTMAGLEGKVADLASSFKKVAVIAFQRGEVSAEERLLALAPDPAPISAAASSVGRRRFAAVAVGAAAALVAVAGWAVLNNEAAAPAAPVSGGLAATRDHDVPHGPAWYPVTPRPAADPPPGASSAPLPAAPPGASSGAGAGFPAPLPTGADESAASPAPPSPGPDCRLGVQLRRIKVCRTPAQ